MIERDPAADCGLMRAITPLKPRVPNPSTVNATSCPAATLGISLAGTAASTSMRDKSTMVNSLVSTEALSPACTARSAIRPAHGAWITVSSTARLASATLASAAFTCACATDELASVVS